MAFLRLFAIRVRKGIVDEISSPNYPLPISQLSFPPLVAKIQNNLRRSCVLPQIDLATTAAVVSYPRLAAYPERRVHAYWVYLWNSRWTEFAPYNELSGRTRSVLKEIAARVRNHEDVVQVEPWLPGATPVALEPIPWVWDRELQTLSLRGILALLLRTLLSLVPLEIGNREVVCAKLRQIASFVAGTGEGQVTSAYAEPIESVQQDFDQGVLSFAAMSYMTVNYTLACMDAVLEFIQHGGTVHLEKLLRIGKLAAFLASQEEFACLLRLGLGTFPELGRPIDIGEDGPLGSIKYARIPRPPGQLLTRDSFDWTIS